MPGRGAQVVLMRDSRLQYGTIGRRAYELRKQGLTWPEIGRRIYRKKQRPGDRASMHGAKFFAKANDLPWPPELPDAVQEQIKQKADAARRRNSRRRAITQRKDRGDGTIGRRVYRLRRRGMKWVDIAFKVYECESIYDWPFESDPSNLVITQARHFAKRYKLTWPPRTTP